MIGLNSPLQVEACTDFCAGLIESTRWAYLWMASTALEIMMEEACMVGLHLGVLNGFHHASTANSTPY